MARLPFRGAGVKKHGAERWQGLCGGRGDGELPVRHDECCSVSSLQWENQTQWGGTTAVTLFMWRWCCCSRRETCRVQSLDATIGHWEDRPDFLSSLGCEYGTHQVAAVCGSCEDAWTDRDVELCGWASLSRWISYSIYRKQIDYNFVIHNPLNRI